jgi:SPP1 gp7 family putative phage head morphogenesis protein
MAAPVQPADPRELYLRGLVARDAFQRWLAGEVLDILDRAFRELVARLVLDDLTPAQRERLARLFVEIDRRLREAYGSVGALTERALTDYGGVEAEAAAADLRARIGFVGEGRVVLTSAALTQPILTAIARLPIQGLTLGEWWGAQAAKMSQATRRAIQTGLTLGETTRDIVKRIIADRGSTSPAVWRAARAEATMIVRTSITAVHAEAALTTYARAGDEITGEYELVTARDNRVSKICAALDGRRFRYNDPKRLVPPFHPNCRTVCVPVINYRQLGLLPPYTPRAGGLTFQSLDAWLRAQPRSVQKAILGATRADWYRAGRLSLRDLIDTDNRVLTLEELRRRLLSPTG